MAGQVPWLLRLLVPVLILSLLHAYQANAQKAVAAGVKSQQDRFWQFASRPDLLPPRWRLRVTDAEALSPGYWFLSPYEDLNQVGHGDPWVGPYIYDQDGIPVWCGTQMFQQFNAFDFRLANYNGEEMMTIVFPEEHNGVIMDNTYKIRKTVDIGHDDTVNMHEFSVIENGARALVLIDHLGKPTLDETHEVGYFNNDQICKTNFDGFREVDLETSETIFEWSSKDHISLTEGTYMEGTIIEMCTGQKGYDWDLLHFNSLDKFPDGDYLLSARHSDALYKISHEDGHIVWRLGGVKSDFEMGDAIFSRQHHARVQDQNETHAIISLFDNAKGTGPQHLNKVTHSKSRAMLLSVQTAPEKKVEVLAEYSHPWGSFADSRGSYQILPNGNAFVSWTYNSLFSEHAPDGRLLMQANFIHGANSYRLYKYPWVGHPSEPPDVYAHAFSNGEDINNTVITMVYVSWNGATEVSFWNLYKADRAGRTLELIVGGAQKEGFETAISHKGYASHVVVEALDSKGEALGRSNVFETIPPENMFGSAVVEEAQWLEDHESTLAAGAKQVAKSPLTALALGIASGAATFALLWFFWLSRRRSAKWWWRRRSVRGSVYALLSGIAREDDSPESTSETNGDVELDNEQARLIMQHEVLKSRS